MSEKHLHIVSFEIPYPANYGGVIDVFYKMKALIDKGFKIHLHCFEYGREHSEVLERLCFSVNYYRRLTNLNKVFQKSPYIACSRESDELVKNLEKDNYPILLEGLHSCSILNRLSLDGRRVFVRTHNVEHEYYRSLAKTEKNLRKKIYLLQESSKLEKFESILNKASGILAISAKDYEYFSKKYKNVTYIQAYTAFDEVNVLPGKGNFVLYHGKLDISENYNAAEFLIKEVFNNSDINLKIAGMNPPKHLINSILKAPNVELVANPDDEALLSLIRNAHINILVTAQSTGLKLKLLNALFNGRFCVVNEKMVKGLDVNGLCHVADSAEDIKKTINKLMDKDFGEKEISLRKERMRNFYNSEETTRQLIDLIG